MLISSSTPQHFSDHFCHLSVFCSESVDWAQKFWFWTSKERKALFTYSTHLQPTLYLRHRAVDLSLSSAFSVIRNWFNGKGCIFSASTSFWQMSVKGQRRSAAGCVPIKTNCEKQGQRLQHLVSFNCHLHRRLITIFYVPYYPLSQLSPLSAVSLSPWAKTISCLSDVMLWWSGHWWKKLYGEKIERHRIKKSWYLDKSVFLLKSFTFVIFCFHFYLTFLCHFHFEAWCWR